MEMISVKSMYGFDEVQQWISNFKVVVLCICVCFKL